MNKVIAAAFILAALFCAQETLATTKCVGYNDRIVIFHDKDNDGKYEKIELIVLNEPTKVITMEEAKQILATFPEGTK
jgi:hypothetical protein